MAKEWWEKYIYAAARKTWRWSPVRKQAKKDARLPNGKLKCEKCKKGFPETETQVDHISPVVPISGKKSWDQYFERLLNVSIEGVQVLCKSCHKEKSKSENALRKAHKK